MKPEIKEIELEPCPLPFCNGKGVVSTTSRAVKCDTCGLTIMSPHSYGYAKSVWNTRTSPVKGISEIVKRSEKHATGCKCTHCQIRNIISGETK